jgi:hypothetical protein
MKGETESDIIAAQDQALQTKYHARKILQTDTDSQCRFCQQSNETLEHIILACPVLAEEYYVKKHDKSVCSATHARKQL